MSKEIKSGVIDPTLSEIRQLEVAERVIELLSLKANSDGLVNTSWGRKSKVGLGACIMRIIKET